MSEPSLHHVGYVVASISEGRERWASALAVTSESKLFEDPIQRARVQFFHFAPAGGATPGTALELVEPMTPDAPVAQFLEKGGGLHHLCFEVDDLEAHLRFMKTQQALLIRQPKPAVAFGGRRIAWMMTREKLLVEYLERAQVQ